MLNLILKDFLIQKKTLLTTFLYSFFVLFVFKAGITPFGSLFIGSVAIAYLFITSAVSYDDKSNSHIVLNSLPTLRRNIVISRYLSTIVFGLIGFIMMLISSTLINLFGISITNFRVNADSIIMLFTVLLLVFSIYYPFYFKYGATKINVLSIFIFLAAIFLPSLIQEVSNKNNFFNKLSNVIPKNALAPGFTVLAIIITLISLILSLRIYNSKDF